MRTEDLTGHYLDLAVAIALRRLHGDIAIDAVRHGFFNPSINPAQGEALIRQEKVWFDLIASWHAHISLDGINYMCSGPTLLIAAMRCIVLSRIGLEVEFDQETMGRLMAGDRTAELLRALKDPSLTPPTFHSERYNTP